MSMGNLSARLFARESPDRIEELFCRKGYSIVNSIQTCSLCYTLPGVPAHFIRGVICSQICGTDLDQSGLPAFLPHSSGLSHQVLSARARWLERSPPLDQR